MQGHPSAPHHTQHSRTGTALQEGLAATSAAAAAPELPLSFGDRPPPLNCSSQRCSAAHVQVGDALQALEQLRQAKLRLAAAAGTGAETAGWRRLLEAEAAADQSAQGLMCAWGAEAACAAYGQA